MRDVGVAARYTRAFLEAAQGGGRLREAWDQLEALARRLRQENRLSRLLQHPFLSLGQQQALLREVSPHPLLPLVERLVLLLVRRKRFHLFPVIVTQVREGVKTAGGKTPAVVRTAVPLLAAAQQRLEAVLTAAFHRPILLEAVRDPELLAGAVVRIGDQVMDYSLRGQLRRLQAQLMSTTEEPLGSGFKVQR